MKFRVFLAVAACKITRNIMRAMGRGATSFPGRVALKIYPDILGQLAKGVRTIIVTGTNGKTTTSRMIEQNLKDSGLSYFANRSGANLIEGITAEYVVNASLTGKNKKEIALIECDEAAFKKVGKYVDPECVLVTNLFRDQLDRFGEITHTLESIRIGITNSPHATVCLNADCSMTTSLGREIPNKVIYFGVNTPIYKERVRESSDAPYCIYCKTEYEYDYITFGHLGKYRCPGCGYERPVPQVAVDKVLASDEDHSEIQIDAMGETYRAVINLPGGYNIYNGVAAVAVAHVMGFSKKEAVEALSDFECGFGRMEKFMLGETPVRMILIKNPAGCNQVLNFLAGLKEEALFVICLNDKYADGTDISWIWDVDFEILQRIQDKLSAILVSGIRKDDMALRLKYAGFPRDKIRPMDSWDSLLEEITTQDRPVYIMPTYTAMMDLRGIISQKYGYKNFWE